MLDDAQPAPFTPAHVPGVMQPMSLPQIVSAARRNALETIPAIAYRQPMVSGKTIIRWHMVMDPGALRRIMLDAVDDYPKSELTQRLLRPAIGTSIFTSEGDEWRWQRRAAAPIFNHRKMVALSPMMTAAADRTAERLAKSIDDGFDGTGVADVMDEMVTATFEIVCDALLSGGEGLDRREIGGAITRYFDTIGKVSILDIAGVPNWIPRPSQLMNRGVMNGTVEMVDKLIASRRASLESYEGADDLLGYMLRAEDPETGQKMDDATLRNNLLSFIVAGHETTALALAWSLYLLANDKAAQDRAAEESRAAIGQGPAAAEHLEHLPYIRQVLDEAMRLYPPAAMLSRTARVDDELCGREVRKGDLVTLPIYALHRHELLWENPLQFNPDNFAPEKAKARDRYAYLPFGAGPRVCIGMNFSLMEAAIILATLLARLEFAPRPGHTPEPVVTMTLRPKGGMPLKVTRRAQ
ncbi:MAG: cytochrome P450 [Pseudomonadota bacterium]